MIDAQKTCKHKPGTIPEEEIGKIVWPDPSLAPESDRARLFELLEWMKDAIQANNALRTTIKQLTQQVDQLTHQQEQMEATIRVLRSKELPHPHHEELH
jgi:hypothetical protein